MSAIRGELAKYHRPKKSPYALDQKERAQQKCVEAIRSHCCLVWLGCKKFRDLGCRRGSPTIGRLAKGKKMWHIGETQPVKTCHLTMKTKLSTAFVLGTV